MKSTVGRSPFLCLWPLIVGCAALVFQTHTVAAPHPDDPSAPPEVAAPLWANAPITGRAHRHADGHRCEAVHAPVAAALMAARPLPMTIQLPSDSEKNARLKRDR